MAETVLEANQRQTQTILFDLVKELKDGVAKLADRLDNVSTRLAYVEGADMKKTLESINDKLADLETKVNRIDKNQAVIYAVAGLIGAAVSVAIGWLKGFFTG